MKTPWVPIVTAAAFTALSPGSAFSTGATMVNKTILDNGLVILTKESRANDIVATSVLLRTGTRYEADERAGFSDLAQHLLLKGTTSRTATEIATEIDALGARLNASAHRDFGSVTLLSTRPHFPEALEILFDVLLHPSFLEDKVALEKEQALRRIQAREDRLLYKAVDLLSEAHYGAHPYHKPSLGYPETVEAFTRDDALAFHERFYIPNNMVITAVGNFESGAFIKRVQATLGTLPRRSLPEPANAPLPTRDAALERTLERESEAAWMSLGYDAPAITEPAYPAMEVLDSVMGGGMNSRLFTELREKRGLAYQVSSVYAARLGPSLYFAYIGTSPEQADSAKAGIIAEMDKICTSAPVPDEVDRAKTYIKGTFIMGQESNQSQAALLAQYELLGLGYQYVDRYPDLITKVTPEDVLAVAQRYLSVPPSLGAVLPADEE